MFISIFKTWGWNESYVSGIPCAVDGGTDHVANEDCHAYNEWSESDQNVLVNNDEENGQAERASHQRLCKESLCIVETGANFVNTKQGVSSDKV